MLFLKFNIEDLYYVRKLRNQYSYGNRRLRGFLVVEVLYMIIVRTFFLFQKVTSLGETWRKRKWSGFRGREVKGSNLGLPV